LAGAAAFAGAFGAGFASALTGGFAGAGALTGARALAGALADAFVGATAQRFGALLIHKDPEFESLKSVIKLKALPYKARG